MKAKRPGLTRTTHGQIQLASTHMVCGVQRALSKDRFQ